MKRRTVAALATLFVCLTLSIVCAQFIIAYDDTYPFRCWTFSRYDLTREDGPRLKFVVNQDLRFTEPHSGYLLLNGQVTIDDNTTLLNREIKLIDGSKIDYDTYRYRIDKIITASTDNTPDAIFNKLLAELVLDNSSLQFDVIKVDSKAYIIGGPLSYLFTCRRF